MSIDTSILGMAGEFAVATELCRRNLYAQLTLGNQRRIDLITLSREGIFLKIEVKAKQGPTWANIKGIAHNGGFLIFVDFSGKGDADRPDFFVLSPEEWQILAQGHVDHYKNTHPGKRADVDEWNCPVFPDQIMSNGRPYRGCTVKVSQIERHKEKWSKILDACLPVTAIEPKSE